MDELHGDQGVWRMDGTALHIRYHTGRRQDALLRRLGRCVVPLTAVSSVDFRPRERRQRWSLRLLLHERADPYAAVGAALSRGSQPFRLTGPAKTELVAEYWADQIAHAATHTARTAPSDLALSLVPAVPLHIATSEGTASFDGNRVRLTWVRSAASARKRKEASREFPLADLTGVEWVPSDGWDWGHLRMITADPVADRPRRPVSDLATLRCDDGSEGAEALLLAATVTAHLWAAGRGLPQPADAAVADPDSQVIYERLRELGRLHAEGVLTEEEFAAKKAELLARL